MPVLEEGDEDRPLAEGIADGFAEQALGKDAGGGAIQPPADAHEDRSAVLGTLAQPGLGIGVANAPLHRIELADQGHHLLRGTGVASVGGIDERAPHVRPTSGVADDPGRTGEDTIGAVAVGLQVERQRRRIDVAREQHPTGTSAARLGAYSNQRTGVPGGPPQNTHM